MLFNRLLGPIGEPKRAMLGRAHPKLQYGIFDSPTVGQLAALLNWRASDSPSLSSTPLVLLTFRLALDNGWSRFTDREKAASQSFAGHGPAKVSASLHAMMSMRL
jgi:hypothetical protein